VTTSPFTDPARSRELYASSGRLARRTSALHAAKIHGADAADTIADLAAAGPAPRVIADIGCGRGTTTRQLAQRFPAARLIAVDQASALLRAARQRLPAGLVTVCADFHRLPFAAASLDVAVAAFCLYHSPRPDLVAAELARSLVQGGRAILVTKSADSYHDLDTLVAASGLDPAAGRLPSLYASFHSGNATRIVGRHLSVRRVVHQRHIFHFTDSAHLAAYLTTTPKYQLPAALTADPQELATVLRCRMGEETVTTTSTVTYVEAIRP
jgi:ubiquinone/menaquinone biosynthesis C-methylase UbiE